MDLLRLEWHLLKKSWEGETVEKRWSSCFHLSFQLLEMAQSVSRVQGEKQQQTAWIKDQLTILLRNAENGHHLAVNPMASINHFQLDTFRFAGLQLLSLRPKHWFPIQFKVKNPKLGALQGYWRCLLTANWSSSQVLWLCSFFKLVLYYNSIYLIVVIFVWLILFELYSFLHREAYYLRMCFPLVKMIWGKMGNV